MIAADEGAGGGADKGLIDFAVILTDVDHTFYRSLTQPAEDRIGLLMPKDCELAKKKEVRFLRPKSKRILAG